MCRYSIPIILLKNKLTGLPIGYSYSVSLKERYMYSVIIVLTGLPIEYTLPIQYSAAVCLVLTGPHKG